MAAATPCQHKKENPEGTFLIGVCVTDPIPNTPKGQALFHIITINKLGQRSLVRPNMSH